MLNIGINDGHTINGPGSGAVGKIIESKETRNVGNLVRQLLKERGHNAINCTIDHASSSREALNLIVQQANRQDLDWFISIHFNASGGRGVEVYTYKGRQYPDAVDVCKNIAALGFNNRGVKEGQVLYVIRKTKAKSMLIECCFVDTADAEKYLQVGARAIAEAIVNSILGVVQSKNETTTIMPLKVAHDMVAMGLNSKGEIFPVKEFRKDDLITVTRIVNKLGEINVNGQTAYITMGYTTKR